MKKATIEQLAKMNNVKFRVTPEQSEMFQEEFFKNGGTWFLGDKDVIQVQDGYLVIKDWLLCSCQTEMFYNLVDLEEIEIISTPSLQEQFEQDCKVHDRPWELWQYYIGREWVICSSKPLFHKSPYYRRNPNADIMIEYFNADDEKRAALQMAYNERDEFGACLSPSFHPSHLYRFKPEYKKPSFQESLEEVKEMYEDSDYDVFSDNAMLSQELRRVISWYDGCDVTKEALEVIIGNISRIVLSSDDCAADWQDIANVAKLIADNFEEKS